METKVIAIEFTLSASTARIFWAGAPAQQRLSDTVRAQPSCRFRIIVPKCGAGPEDRNSVLAFYQHKNALLNETNWLPIPRDGVVVGGFTVWHRVALVLALQVLFMRLTSKALVIEDGALEASGIDIQELPTGAMMVDLQEV
jgi:hypothetical protein